MNNMNKKGATLGILIMIFIGIIVALALFAGTFESVGNMRTIYTSTGEPITTAAVNSSIVLTGRENTTVITVINATGGQDWTANFGVTTRNSGGALAILLTTSQAAGNAGQNLTGANVTYSYKPQGYNDSSGARGIIQIILIFAALAIALVAIPGFRDMLNDIKG